MAPDGVRRIEHICRIGLRVSEGPSGGPRWPLVAVLHAFLDQGWPLMTSDGPFACRYDDPHIEFERLLLAPGPDLFVMDEAHRIKNDGATLSKALARVATRKRVLLTGTPLQNNLVEYYHMVDFVSPGMLMGADGRGWARMATDRLTDCLPHCMRMGGECYRVHLMGH